MQPVALDLDSVVYLPTGFEALDKLLGGKGLRRGSTILLRGGPGTGKTTLALQISRSALVDAKHSILYVMFEEPGPSSLEEITQTYWGTNLETYFAGPADRRSVFNAVTYLDRAAKEIAEREFVRQASEFYKSDAADPRLGAADGRPNFFAVRSRKQITGRRPRSRNALPYGLSFSLFSFSLDAALFRSITPDRRQSLTKAPGGFVVVVAGRRSSRLVGRLRRRRRRPDPGRW